MSLLEAFILGLIQGLTEFLPVSSSGHLEIGKHLLGVQMDDSLTFTIVIHGATVLSTLIVFRDDIVKLLLGLAKLKWNDETRFLAKIAVSMIPIIIVGLFFRDAVESVFESAKILLIVGSMLLLTSLLLAFAYYRKPGDKDISFFHAFIIGIAQVFAVMPGLSRSGTTIATGLLLGNRKDELARFSFLMVLVPILGENLLSVLKNGEVVQAATQGPGIEVLVVGFVAAFIAGLLACKWMINIVKKGKLIWFAIYCAIIGLVAITGNLLA